MASLWFSMLAVCAIGLKFSEAYTCPLHCESGCLKVLKPYVIDYDCTSRGRCLLRRHFGEEYRVSYKKLIIISNCKFKI